MTKHQQVIVLWNHILWQDIHHQTSPVAFWGKWRQSYSVSIRHFRSISCSLKFQNFRGFCKERLIYLTRMLCLLMSWVKDKTIYLSCVSAFAQYLFQGTFKFISKAFTLNPLQHVLPQWVFLYLTHGFSHISVSYRTEYLSSMNNSKQ